MNKNHYDHKLIYTSKIARIEGLINKLVYAENMLNTIPEELVRNNWLKLVDKHLNEKTKTITKTFYRKSMRKTIKAVIIAQRQLKEETEKKLAEVDEQALAYEQTLMARLRMMILRKIAQSENRQTA